jgi:hypothetical protein
MTTQIRTCLTVEFKAYFLIFRYDYSLESGGGYSSGALSTGLDDIQRVTVPKLLNKFQRGRIFPAQTANFDSTLYVADSADCWGIFVQLKGK